MATARKRAKWDVGATSDSHGTAESPAQQQAKAAAAQALAKFHASREAAAASQNVEINDAPQHVRFALVRKPSLATVEHQTSTLIQVRGRYYPPGTPRTAVDPALHLNIAPAVGCGNDPAVRSHAVGRAVAHIQAFMRGEVNLSDPVRPSLPPVPTMHAAPSLYHAAPQPHARGVPGMMTRHRPPDVPAHGAHFGAPGYSGAASQAGHVPPPHMQHSWRPTNGSASALPPVPAVTATDQHQQQPQQQMQQHSQPTPSSSAPGVAPGGLSLSLPASEPGALVLPLDFAVPDGFPVADQIRGPDGSYLRHIESSNQVTVYLRGRGAGAVHASTRPLELVIVHPEPWKRTAAADLARSLLQTVRTAAEAWGQSERGVAAMGARAESASSAAHASPPDRDAAAYTESQHSGQHLIGRDDEGAVSGRDDSARTGHAAHSSTAAAAAPGQLAVRPNVTNACNSGYAVTGASMHANGAIPGVQQAAYAPPNGYSAAQANPYAPRPPGAATPHVTPGAPPGVPGYAPPYAPPQAYPQAPPHMGHNVAPAWNTHQPGYHAAPPSRPPQPPAHVNNAAHAPPYAAAPRDPAAQPQFSAPEQQGAPGRRGGLREEGPSGATASRGAALAAAEAPKAAKKRVFKEFKEVKESSEGAAKPKAELPAYYAFLADKRDSAEGQNAQDPAGSNAATGTPAQSPGTYGPQPADDRPKQGPLFSSAYSSLDD